MPKLYFSFVSVFWKKHPHMFSIIFWSKKPQPLGGTRYRPKAADKKYL